MEKEKILTMSVVPTAIILGIYGLAIALTEEILFLIPTALVILFYILPMLFYREKNETQKISKKEKKAALTVGAVVILINTLISTNTIISGIISLILYVTLTKIWRW